MDISKIDKNMKVEATINKDGLNFYDVRSEPFRVYGVFWEDGRFRRVPESVAAATNDGVHFLAKNTAGGRVRFVTNSSKVAVMVKRDGASQSDNISPLNTTGMDMYVGEKFVGVFRAGTGDPAEFEYVLNIPKHLRGGVVNINMTDYGCIKEILVGVCDGSTLEAAPDYQYERPVVFYGSSITQGGCASRPGMAYEEILSRRLNMNYINLGFSGSARGEESISDYIKNLDMSVFVYDYDHNAPNIQHLTNTHERMFLEIREAHPDLPIIMMTRPDYQNNDDCNGRIEIVKRTYDNARARGDRNVYFICGKEFFGDNGLEFTVDGCHPSDIGFYRMASVIEPVLREVFEKLEK